MRLVSALVGAMAAVGALAPPAAWWHVNHPRLVHTAPVIVERHIEMPVPGPTVTEHEHHHHYETIHLPAEKITERVTEQAPAMPDPGLQRLADLEEKRQADERKRREDCFAQRFRGGDSISCY